MIVMSYVCEDRFCFIKAIENEVMCDVYEDSTVIAVANQQEDPTWKRSLT